MAAELVERASERSPATGRRSCRRPLREAVVTTRQNLNELKERTHDDPLDF
ncbi:hypothetical protein GCM10010468_04080 [Actinocorallia longicatena]|uniref:Uncharacterized protein n=1 Tax=Actinocorallia longicatena TaxID=111803 RepID=A0ABP6PX96_9ACTN